MADYQLTSAIHDLVAEDGRDIIYQQARLTCGLVDLALPSEEKYRPKPTKQRYEKPITVKRMAKEVGTVQVKKGGLRSFGVTSDGATRRPGSAVQFSKGKYDPKVVEGELELPLVAAHVVAGGAGIDYVDEQLRTLGSQLGAHLDRAVSGTQLASVSATASAGATTFTTTDPSGLVEGEEVDHYLANDTFAQTFRVTNIAPPATMFGDWTVTVESALAVQILATGKLYQSGGGSSTNRLASLSDVCSSSTSMYGLTTAQFPSGLSLSLSSWDNISGRRMGDLLALQSGSRPTHIATSSIGASKIINQSVAQRRFNSGDMDPYGGAVPKFDDLPIVVSEQLSASTIRFINADKCFLHEFMPFGFVADGMGANGFGASVLRASETKLSLKGLGQGAYEFVCNHRRAFGEFTSVGDV